MSVPAARFVRRTGLAFAIVGVPLEVARVRKRRGLVLNHFTTPAHNQPNRTGATQRRLPVRSFRTLMWVLFAVVLLSIAGVSNGAEPVVPKQPPQRPQPVEPIAEGSTTIQYDGTTYVVASASQTPQSRAAVEARRQAIARRSAARPKYVEMIASLANFDADADPDGWRVELVLLDSRDRPVVTRASAMFQLMPRVPTADHFNYVDAARLPVRWSKPLEFDEDGVARVKLPLRESLRPLFGWPSAVFPHHGARTRVTHSLDRRGGNPWRSRSVVRDDWRNQLGRPSMGEIRVRVSVPTEGVFRAATIVPIRPPALVDTYWPYR